MGRAKRAEHPDSRQLSVPHEALATLARLAEAAPPESAPMSATLTPSSAMVFAAGLGTRMRPVTDTMPKSLVEVGGKALIDHMLDRFAEAGLARAIVNVHYRADQLEAHLAGPHAPGDRPLGRARRACSTRAAASSWRCRCSATPRSSSATPTQFWLEGPHSNLAALAARWDPEAMDVLLLVAATTSSVGVDWSGRFHDARRWTPGEARRARRRAVRLRRSRHHQGRAVRRVRRTGRSGSRPISSRRRRRAACSATGSTANGCMSARRRRSPRRRRRSSARCIDAGARVRTGRRRS